MFNEISATNVGEGFSLPFNAFAESAVSANGGLKPAAINGHVEKISAGRTLLE